MDSIWEYRNLLLAGTAVTVQLALASLALSVVLGLVGAAAKRFVLLLRSAVPYLMERL